MVNDMPAFGDTLCPVSKVHEMDDRIIRIGLLAWKNYSAMH